MNYKKGFPYFFLLIITIVVFTNCNNDANSNTKQTAIAVVQPQEGLNRNPAHIHYSKHAKCRMDCRHIDEAEVKDMIATGTINYKKSDLQKNDCNKPKLRNSRFKRILKDFGIVPKPTKPRSSFFAESYF